MLERDVLIDGEVWPSHEVTSATLVVSQYIVTTVRSAKVRDDGETASIETFHELPWADGMRIAEIESAVWALPEMQGYVDAESALDEVLDMLNDEQAESVTQLYHEWAAGIEYEVGKRVRYDGKLYRCVQAHTSSAEYTPLVHSLWTRTAAEGEIPDWVQPEGSHDAYGTGDKVKHNGKTWVSTMDANVYEPGVYGWDEVAA